MKYDFDKVTDRRGTNSLKWDVKENELPMWVADMDFETAPEIKDAIISRAAHGVFGYGVIPDEWYGAYTGWWKRRHGFDMKKEGLIFCTGVIPAISSAVRKLTTPGEKVLIQTPVYNIFFNSILNNGCTVLENPLIYKDGGYEMDLADLDKKLSDPQVSLMILCNPQNPVGKIWDAQTLAKVGELAKKHGVTVISDEIHCDITSPGKKYVPFASVNQVNRDISITCIAPTKAFNIAGIQTAAVYAENPFLRHKIYRAINTDEVAEPNVFAVPAAIAAFEKGEDWLDELNEYIEKNKNTVCAFLSQNLPEIRAVKSDCTYLMWLDCSSVSASSKELCAYIRHTTGLYLSHGEQYGKSGKCFIRLNTACPGSVLNDGLERFHSGVKSYLEHIKHSGC